MDKKPNLILITIDALRADHLGFMGYKKDISPNIDNLSKESNIFTRAFSVAPVTPYSFPSILTSTYPLDYQGPEQIRKPRVLVSEVFKKQGFITAAFHSCPYLSDYFGYNKGWDFFEDITFSSNNSSPGNNFLKKIFKKTIISTFPQLLFWIFYLEYKIKGPNRVKVKASFINRIVKDFIRSIKTENKPFFLWIHYMDVHTPPFCYSEGKSCSFSELIGDYVGSAIWTYGNKGALRRFIKNNFNKYIKKTQVSYDEAIRYLDNELGELLSFLKKENIYQNSVICLTADHGDEFLEHGGLGHNIQLYNELMHVPLLIKIPGDKPRVIKQKISLIDLPTTICDFFEIKKPPSFKGKNLFTSPTNPIFHQTAINFNLEKEENEAIFNLKVLNQCKMACQSKNWKYILNYNTKKEELYNLLEDSKEQNNLVDSEPEILFKMRKKIQEFKEKNPLLSLVSSSKNYEH